MDGVGYSLVYSIGPFRFVFSLKIFFFMIYFLLLKCVYVIVCMWLVSPLPKGQKSVLDPLELELHIILNSALLQEQCVLQPIESSLQLLKEFFKGRRDSKLNYVYF